MLGRHNGYPQQFPWRGGCPASVRTTLSSSSIDVCLMRWQESLMNLRKVHGEFCPTGLQTLSTISDGSRIGLFIRGRGLKDST